MEDGIVNDSVESSLNLLNTTYYLFYLLSSVLRPVDKKSVFPQELILDRFFNYIYFIAILLINKNIAILHIDIIDTCDIFDVYFVGDS